MCIIFTDFGGQGLSCLSQMLFTSLQDTKGDFSVATFAEQSQHFVTLLGCGTWLLQREKKNIPTASRSAQTCSAISQETAKTHFNHKLNWFSTLCEKNTQTLVPPLRPPPLPSKHALSCSQTDASKTCLAKSLDLVSYAKSGNKEKVWGKGRTGWHRCAKPTVLHCPLSSCFQHLLLRQQLLWESFTVFCKVKFLLQRHC